MKPSLKHLVDRPLTSNRRGFLKTFGAAAAVGTFWAEEQLQAYQQNVNTNSKPSDLKITDMRVATVVGAPMRCPIIRIDTNQGVYGLGEVRDGASKNYALMLKRIILNENPCNVDKIFRKIKQFGGHARQGGGVCGVEMALWDIAGKVYNVPAYQMLGGKFRDRVRCYADTTENKDPKIFATRLKKRIDEKGFTFLKMDLGVDLVEDQPYVMSKPLGTQSRDFGNVQHQFTGMELTPKGVEAMVNYVAQVREVIGMEVPLAADHFGHVGMNSCIRLGRALEKYNMAWLEDMIPWQYTTQLKEIKDNINIPLLTGEDIYLKEPFENLCRAGAVDMIHPDLATSGGLLETKKIGDMAQGYGIPMAMHFAGTPISFMANVHCAAATENFVALEHHSVDVPWWEDMVQGAKPLFSKGFAAVPSAPGLGVTLNDDVVKQHLDPNDNGFFLPTPDWDRDRVNDRLWS
jgi:L-alanine-DL-glutamate epimerase-like enolase superfamily enzyme